MNEKLYKYELSEEVVNYILNALNRVQIAGVQQAQSLLNVVTLLQSPVNQDDLDKKQLEELKAKYEPTKEEKKK